MVSLFQPTVGPSMIEYVTLYHVLPAKTGGGPVLATKLVSEQTDSFLSHPYVRPIHRLGSCRIEDIRDD